MATECLRGHRFTFGTSCREVRLTLIQGKTPAAETGVDFLSCHPITLPQNTPSSLSHLLESNHGETLLPNYLRVLLKEMAVLCTRTLRTLW
jgi:hypothetical protein